MAALQTLRNKPALLMSVIGGALLLFIVTLADFNSCSRPNVEGEVNGKELTYEEYEQQVSDETNLESLLLDNVSDQEKDQIRQRLWENFKQQQIIAKQADELGLIVTKEDVQNEISSVSPQQLQQIMQMVQYGQMDFSRITYAQKLMLLMAKYVGQPTVDGYKQFLKTADQQIKQMQQQNPEAAEMLSNLKKACLYCESQIPSEILQNKYLALVQQGVISNPISARMSFDEEGTTYSLEMANIPYATVADKDVTITDDDLKAKYEELKPLFRIYGNSRDLKVIDVQVAASSKDQANTIAQVRKLEGQLRQASTAKAVEEVMKSSKSDVQYQNVYVTKDLLNQSSLQDVASALDSVSTGSVTATKVEPKGQDGVQYVSTFKLVDKKLTPDSMQICRLAVDSKADAEKIVGEVKKGATLSSLAAKYTAAVQKYGLKGDTTWVETKYYVSVDAAAAKDSTTSQYTDVCQMPVGTVSYMTIPNQQDGKSVYVVTQVISAKSPSEKYNVAVVKYPMNFSQQTYSDKKRQLSEFLAKNRTLASLEKNASRSGFTLMDLPNFSTSDAMSARLSIGGEKTKDAFVWAFGDAKEGEVSQIYECGKENDHLLVIAVAAINDGDYLAWDNPSVKKQLEQLVRQDKKAEKILASVKNVKSFAQTRSIKGVQISKQDAVNVSSIEQYEPALAGAIERTKKGAFTGAVKGSMGIVMAQVDGVKAPATAFNPAAAMTSEVYKQLNVIFGQSGSIIESLEHEADIEDNRYKF